VIYGIPDSFSREPYHDLNEVLNKIGVMAKRTEIPFARITHLTRKKKYDYRRFDGYAYVVPKDWRNCLYEDLETGDYYIVSPHPENKGSEYSWIAFKLSGLTDGITHYGEDDSGRIVKEILHHSGSFIDLMWRCSLNEILDALANTQKPIVIRVIRYLYYLHNDLREEKGAVCRFDI
jgi:hypothetical protein